MSPHSRVYQACLDLFNKYPLAVSAIDHVPTMHSMVLMLGDGDDVGFFVLLRNSGNSRPAFSISPWRTDDVVTIEADRGDVPGPAVKAVTEGIPIPRDGSIFGWTCQEIVTALTVVYAGDSPVPSWSVMPLAGTPEAYWPPFTDVCLLGGWFWHYHQTGDLIYLGDLIAATPGTVFWVDTYAALGSDCCVVARDIKTPEGRILRHGTYLDSVALRTGMAVPSLNELLDDASKTDLAPSFQVCASADR